MKRAGMVAAMVMVAAVAGIFRAGAGWAQSNGEGGKQGVERLYVLDCGQGHAADQSRWSPGVNVGKPIDISVSCYLIRHAQGYFLWDTGITDEVAAMPNGWLPGNDAANGIHWTRRKTLAAQLKEIGVAPSDIRSIGISHAHPDHIGNIEMFPRTTVLIQKAEFDDYFAPGHAPVQTPSAATATFSKDHPATLIQEDLDVFGDGSVVIFYTPGHTPGHDSLLVHLPKTGWVILSGDAVHMQGNWDNRRIPYFFRLSSEAKMQTLTSMQRIADLMSFYKAQLWILHDKAQTDRQRHAPEYYE